MGLTIFGQDHRTLIMLGTSRRIQLRGTPWTEAGLLLFFVFFLGQARQRYDPLTFLQIDQSHTLRVPADDPDVFNAKPYNLARVGHQHELIILGYLLRAHDAAGLVGRFHCDDALAAAGLEPILVGFRALPETILGDRQHIAAEAQYLHAHHRIPVVEPHTDDA